MQVGDRVNRLEDRDVVGATVKDIVNDLNENTILLIEYDEGGEGWWPLNTLELQKN
jgi:hypothetical protein